MIRWHDTSSRGWGRPTEKISWQRPRGKDSHVGVGWTGLKNLSAYVPLGATDSGVLFTDRPETVKDKRPPLSRQGSRLAILVYQGSDPTQPYPTLVIRQSATLSLRLFAWDMDDVVRPLVWIGAMWDQPPLTLLMISALTPIWPRPRGGFRRWPWVQIPASSGPEPFPPPTTPLPLGGPREGAGPSRRRGFAEADPELLHDQERI